MSLKIMCYLAAKLIKPTFSLRCKISNYYSLARMFEGCTFSLLHKEHRCQQCPHLHVNLAVNINFMLEIFI